MTFTDADAAALYELLNPWDGNRYASDAFYDEFVRHASAVLDVGCGPGSMLCHARESGHTGRLVGLDPDPSALARARGKRDDIEWEQAKVADTSWDKAFDLVTMVSHTFQLLVTDQAVDKSLAAVHNALVPGGLFVFETRHPQARAWDEWDPDHPTDVIDESGRNLRVVYQVEDEVDDLVTLTETTIDWDRGDVLRVDRAILRFLPVDALNAFLKRAGFEIVAQFGDWDRGPITEASAEIITVAARPGPSVSFPWLQGAGALIRLTAEALEAW